jgi:hypothetical protein
MHADAMSGSAVVSREPESFMRRLGSITLAVMLAACAASAPKPVALAPPIDPRPPLVRLGDSTSILIAAAARVSDSANVHARIALGEAAPDRVRLRVQNARESASSASRLVEAAIAQGDYIKEALPGMSGAKGESASYARYWAIGREKLELARTKASSAADAADRALACTAAACTASTTQELQGYVEQAAGASREAESLVRIAMVYVGMAMNYVR